MTAQTSFAIDPSVCAWCPLTATTRHQGSTSCADCTRLDGDGRVKSWMFHHRKGEKR